MAKIRSKFGEQQLIMVNYACGLNQSETGKYFEWIIKHITWTDNEEGEEKYFNKGRDKLRFSHL